MRIVPVSASPRGKASISVELDSLGDEVVALFTLNFDASILSNPIVTLEEGMPEGITLTANSRRAADGRLTILLDSPNAFARGKSTPVVTVTFDVTKGAPIDDTPITFEGSGSFADAPARSLDAIYKDGVVTIKGRSLVSLLTQNYEFGTFPIFGMARR